MSSSTETEPDLDGAPVEITQLEPANEAYWREREFRALVEHSPDVIVRFDRSLRRIYVNEATEWVTGIPRAQLLGKTHAESGMAAEIVDFWQTHLSTAFETGERRAVEYRFPTGDAVLYFDCHFVPEYADDGTIKSVLTVGRDVTERKRAEMAQSFLAEAGEILASSLDLEATLSRVVHLAVPALADTCSVTIAEESGDLRHLAFAHAGSTGDDIREQMFQQGIPVDPDTPFGVAQVLRSGRPVLYENVPVELLRRNTDRFPQFEVLLQIGIVSAMMVPLTVQERTFGVLAFIYGDSSRRYTQRDLALAEEIASRAAMAIENARLYHEAQEAERLSRAQAERLAVLAEAVQIFGSGSLDLPSVFENISSYIGKLVGDMCVIRLLSPDRKWLEALGLYHVDPTLREPLQAALGGPRPADDWLVGSVVTTGRPNRIHSYDEWRAMRGEAEDVSADSPSDRFLRDLKPQSSIVVPLKVADEVIGTLTVTRHLSPAPYTDEDEYFLQALADRAAQAIDNARLHREAREAEARYRALIEQIPAVTLTFDDDRPHHALYVSPQVEGLLGYGPEEWQTKPQLWQEFIHPDDLDRVRAEMRRASEAGHAFVTEYRMLRRDGRTIWVRDEAVLVRDPDGQRLFWQVMVTDITRQRLAEEEIRYQAHLLDVVDQAVIAAEIDGTIVYWNRFAEQLYCRTKDEAIGMRAQDAITTVSTSDDAEHIFRCLEAGESWTGEFVVRDREGREFPALVTESPVFDEHGALVGLVGVSIDISEQKQVERERERAERMLRDAEARYRSLVENMPAVTYIRTCDEVSVVTYVSPQVETVLGYSPEECENQAFWREITHPEDQELLRAEEESANPSETSFHSEYRVFAQDGRTVWLRDEAVQVSDELGAPLYWQGVLLDITDRKELEGELTHQAFHDMLTGLPNRALFLDRAGHARDRSRRSRASLAILFIDLDNFKIVNDSLGHTVGDQLLVAAADRLQRCLREGDTAARFGGDEFAVLLEDISGPDIITGVADRIVEGFQQPFTLQGREVFITPSIGIAVGGRGSDEPEDLLRNADAAMYRAKRLGKARYEVFDPSMTVYAIRRLELENDLRRAIERDEFVLHYHPLVNLESGAITGLEALVRWNHPARGLVPPAEFIRIAEETGLILPIGRWVLDEACRQAREWHRELGQQTPPTMAVNLSGRQFNDPNLVEHVASALSRSGLDPSHLVLEITESAMVEEYQSALQILNALSDLGVTIAIDDFGTGYSSLGVLRSFPVDALKIDRSFIDGLRADPSDTVIVSGIIGLARAMNLRVVAEGIETAAQLRQVRDLGCQIGQGYYFGKPMTAAATRSYLSAAVEVRAAS